MPKSAATTVDEYLHCLPDTSLALDAIASSVASLPVDDYIALHERSRATSRKA